MGCLFCDWLKENKQVVWEDSKIVVFMGSLVYSKGHVLVCPKKHFESLYDVPKELIDSLFHVSLEMGRKLKKNLGADGLHIAMAEKVYEVEPESDTHIAHIHMHVIPRRKGELVIFKEKVKLTEKEVKELIEKFRT